MPRVYSVKWDRCSVEGCLKGGPYYRSWCRMHYTRWQRHGDPLITCSKFYGVPEKYLQDCIAHRDRSEGCWIWPFAKQSKGAFSYGRLMFQGEAMSAPRAALLADGKPKPAPPDNTALHSCDNPPCFNPAHLRWGSHAENMADLSKRFRGTVGTKSWSAKLTEADIPLIRKDTRVGWRIAQDYGVKDQAIFDIKNGVTWKHVK